MKTPLLLLCILLVPEFAHSQDGWSNPLYQYFDGNDTIEYETLKVIIDYEANKDSVWQIGPPQKVLFDTASTTPNVLITDTINPYPINSRSWFELDFPQTFDEELYNSGGILAIHWLQKLDLDSAKDGGLLELSMDSGATWENSFDSPYTYNFYGWNSQNVGTIGLDTMAFTGTDTIWRDVWLCFEMWFLSNLEMGHLRIRYMLHSDTIETDQEGWMIDNMMAHITWVHTIGEQEQANYLNVYPNPTDGRVHIQARKIKAYHIVERLEVFNSQGQIVRSFENVPTKFFVDLDDQPNGTYFVKVQTNFETETFPVILLRE